MTKSRLVKDEYANMCAVCGRPAVTHHLVFGFGLRELADADGLTLPLCENHHTGAEGIHNNPIAEYLSKALGQAAYEQEHTREEFMTRYGRSWL